MPIANVNAPFGFRFHRLGGARGLNIQRHPVPAGRASPLMVGDPYTIETDGTSIKAGDGDTVRGIVMGIEFQEANAARPTESLDYLGVSESGYILGSESPDVEWEVQQTGTALTLGNIGDKIDVAGTDGNTTMRQSRESINGADVGGGAAQFIILGLVDSPADNAIGASSRWRVKLAQALGA